MYSLLTKNKDVVIVNAYRFPKGDTEEFIFDGTNYFQIPNDLTANAPFNIKYDLFMPSAGYANFKIILNYAPERINVTEGLTMECRDGEFIRVDTVQTDLTQRFVFDAYMSVEVNYNGTLLELTLDGVTLTSNMTTFTPSTQVNGFVGARLNGANVIYSGVKMKNLEVNGNSYYPGASGVVELNI